MKRLAILFLLTYIFVCYADDVTVKRHWAFSGNPLLFAHICNGSDDLLASYESGLAPEEENQYIITIKEELPKHSDITIKFDSEAIVTLLDRTVARISVYNDKFSIKFYKDGVNVGIKVKGPRIGKVPYVTSFVINTVEYCKEPLVGFLDDVIKGYQDTAEIVLTVPDDTCGRRKVEHTELITNGLDTKPGDWPWHVAVYKLDKATIKYICGGTLISKTLILTAAHCATIRGVPVLAEILSVVLGKYNLIGGDPDVQEREVHKIIVHANFNHTNLDNDIALLKMKTEAIYNNYVQPACIWNSKAYEQLPPNGIIGSVVGWGFDHSDSLSSQLRQALMPKVSDSVCLKSNPLFFSRLLTDHKFCAGFKNGTSACNGDSGGGFLIFVPDTAGDQSPKAPGAWYVRGIVSVGVARRNVALCDPNEYVLFTDIAKYKGWLREHMD